MKKVEFENVSFRFGMKVLYMGREYDVLAVYFEDYKIGFHDPACLNQERIVSCKDVEIVK